MLRKRCVLDLVLECDLFEGGGLWLCALDA